MNNMTMEQKINQLQNLLAKAELNIGYALNVKFGKDKEETINKIKLAIKHATDLFIRGGIQNVDLSTRESTWNYWENTIDGYLSMFPEFYENEEIKNGKMY